MFVTPVVPGFSLLRRRWRWLTALGFGFARLGFLGVFIEHERNTSRVRVRGRLQEMIQTEIRNLCRAESVLRCVALSMDYEPLDAGSPYYPDVVEVAVDLVKRSLEDLDALHSGYIPDPLMAARNVER